VHLPASLHLVDALLGAALGVVASGAVAGVAVLRPAWVRAAVWWAAVGAGTVAMFLARGVHHRLYRDVAANAATAGVVVGAVAAVGWSRLSDRMGDAWLVAIVALSGVGVWAAVPDTETTAALLAAWVPLMVWAFVSARRADPEHAVGTAAVVAAFLGVVATAAALGWSAAWGAGTWEYVVPGALTCFGVALLVAVDAPAGFTRVPTGVLVGVHAAMVLAASRWATAVSTVAGGAARGAAVIAVGAGVLAAVRFSRRAGEPAHLPPSGPVAHRR
jgi:hypothetical protein